MYSNNDLIIYYLYSARYMWIWSNLFHNNFRLADNLYTLSLQVRTTAKILRIKKSRFSLLKFLKSRCLFSRALSCSLARCSLVLWFPARKKEGFQMQRCHAISRQGKLPEQSRSPPPRQSVRADGLTYADFMTKISCMDRFPKKSYPCCSAGALRAPKLRY